MRPILSATNTYNFALAKWLDDKLKPLSINQYTITDTFELVNEVHGLTINSGDMLVSFDVSSLFTNVPLEETIHILADKAFMNNWFNVTHGLNLSKQDLVDLLRGATKDQLFLFNGQLYEQTDGVAMGSPLGPLLANVFMCSIEETLERDGKMPAYYRRYVDDTLTIVPNIASANEFLETLNHCHPSLSSLWRLRIMECFRFWAHSSLTNLHKSKPKCMSNLPTLAFCCITRAMLMIATSAAY